MSAESTPPETSAAGNPRPRHGVLIRFGHFFFRYRDYLFPLVALPLIVLTRPIAHSGGAAWSYALDALGIALVAGGQALRMAVIGLKYIRRGGRHGKIHADSLVQEGLFARSRNPLYLGNLMAMAGFCLIHDSVLCYAIAIPFFLFAYLTIVLAEEDYLRGRFGEEFDDYCRRVNRFLPGLRGPSLFVEGQQFDWKKVIRKEYNSTAVWATLVLLLLGWDLWLVQGWERTQATAIVLAVLWIPVAIGYGVARYCKLAGLLGGTHAVWPKSRRAKRLAAARAARAAEHGVPGTEEG